MLAPEMWDMEVDLVAVGSSSGGLVGAIVGHDLHLSTVVLEAADTLGGATALSGGVIWIPCTHHALDIGVSDSREEALTYLRQISKGYHDEEVVAAYLDNGPEMLRYIEEHTPLKMAVYPGYGDYYLDLPGAKPSGRTLLPDPLRMAQVLMEAEKAQPFLSKVRREPVPLFLGLPEMDTLYVAGRALIASLVSGCLDRNINILTDTRARDPIVQDGRVIGLRAEQRGQDFFIRAKKAVLLATGGFEWNEEMNKRFLHGPDVHPVSPPSNQGDGHIIGMELGAATALMNRSNWIPTIRIPGEEIDGVPLYRLFMYSTGRPGMILVNRHGKRCCNESFYPDIGRAFVTYDPIRLEFANVPMFWIADQSLRDKYPVGLLPVGREMANWLHRGNDLRELAERLDLPGDNLEETVERFNVFAREGRDPDFHRGEGLWDRHWGDPDNKPNPALRALERPPFYGVQVHPGTVGHVGGLVINGSAQVLNVRGKVIPGLYATSNTTAHLVIGLGYNSGCVTGKSMIFGYIAARHVAESSRQLSS